MRAGRPLGLRTMCSPPTDLRGWAPRLSLIPRACASASRLWASDASPGRTFWSFTETASAASVKLQNVRPGDASEAQSRLAEAHALGIKDSLGAHPRRSVGGEHMVRKPSGRPARMQHQRHNLDAQIVAAETERDGIQRQRPAGKPMAFAIYEFTTLEQHSGASRVVNSSMANAMGFPAGR